MSTVKLTADSGGGSVALKAPATTTSNADLEITVPDVATGSSLVTAESNTNVNIGAKKSVAFPSGTGIQVYSSANPRIKLVNDTTGNNSTDGTQIYLSSDGDTIIDNKDSEDIVFHTNAAEKLRLTSAGKLGSNISTPTHQLHVAGGSAVIDATNNGYGGLKITDSTGGDYSARYYAGRNQTGTAHVFYTGGRTQGTTPWADETGTEIARISGNGIAFNGDTAASNSLDDYEEGTWTFSFGGDTTDPTYNVQSSACTYTKIGNVVHFSGDISFNNWSDGVGYLLWKGLPFSSKASSYSGHAILTYANGLDNNPGDGLPYASYVVKNSSYFYINQADSNTAPLYANQVATSYSCHFIFHGTYTTD